MRSIVGSGHFCIFLYLTMVVTVQPVEVSPSKGIAILKLCHILLINNQISFLRKLLIEKGLKGKTIGCFGTHE